MIADECPPLEMASGRPFKLESANGFGYAQPEVSRSPPSRSSSSLSPSPRTDQKDSSSATTSPADSGVFDMNDDASSVSTLDATTTKSRRSNTPFLKSPLFHSRIPVSGRKALVSSDQYSPETSPRTPTFEGGLPNCPPTPSSARPASRFFAEGFSQIPRPTSSSPTKGLLSPNGRSAPRMPSPSPSMSKSGRSVSAGNTGTGKVIGDLQNELAASKAALEGTKAQLRLSQRAVEYLGRQTDNLKDGRERLRLENESLARTLARKERSLEEAMTRALAAEGSLTGVREAHKRIQAEGVKTAKEADERVVEAEMRAIKAESEYESLRSSVSGLREEWRRQGAELRSELERVQRTHSKNLEENKIKQRARECCACCRIALGSS
jgi:hypothetical protein